MGGVAVLRGSVCIHLLFYNGVRGGVVIFWGFSITGLSMVCIFGDISP